MKEAEFSFNVLIEEQDGIHVANCLEMGLVAVHSDPEHLVEIMAKLITRQLKFALENENPSDIYRSAPPEVWKKFSEAVTARQQPPTRLEKPINVGGWPIINFSQLSYATCA